MDIPRNSAAGTTHPVTLKITYKDNLRNSHEFVTSANAVLAQQQASASPAGRIIQNQNGSQFFMMVVIIIGVAIAAAAAAFFVVKKRRANAKKLKEVQDDGPDKRKNIEDILENPATDTKDPPTSS